MEKQLSENKMVAFNIASTAIIASLNFITTPIFTRMLDQASYGIVTVYSSWVQIFTVLIGLEMRGVIGPAHANLPEEEQDPFQFSALLLSFCSFSVFLIIALLLNKLLATVMELPPALVVCMVVQSLGSCLIVFFNARFIFAKQANKNFVLTTVLSLSTLALAMLLIALVPAETDRYMGWVLGFMVPNIVIGIFLFLRFSKRRFHSFSLAYWKFALLIAGPLILHGLSSVLLAQVGKIAIQQFYDDSLVAIYGIAVTVALFINAVYSALNSAFVPFMYDDLAGKTSERVKQSHFKNYMMLFTLGLCAYLFGAPEVLKAIAPPSYWGAIEILPILIIGQYCIFLYSFSVNFELFSMKPKYVAVGTVSTTLINIGITVVLVPLLGMLGAALSTMLAWFLLFVFHFFIARFLLHDRNYPIRYLFIGLLFVVACAMMTSFLVEDVILRWVIALGLILVDGIMIVRRRTIF